MLTLEKDRSPLFRQMNSVSIPGAHLAPPMCQKRDRDSRQCRSRKTEPNSVFCFDSEKGVWRDVHKALFVFIEAVLEQVHWVVND